MGGCTTFALAPSAVKDSEPSNHMTRSELRPHLANWTKLNALFQSQPSRADLQRLLDMERRGKQRGHIIKRITGRLATVETKLRREGKL